MKKETVRPLFILILIAATLTASIPVAFSSEHIVYDPASNISVVHPTGEDDTSNLYEAFDTVVAGGPGGKVQLVEGVYTISSKIIVKNFDGWFQGAGMHKTIVENEYTESFPHYDVEYFPDLAGLFLFYQTDDTPRTLRFSDMTIKVHGETYDYDGFTGMNVFDVVGKVDGDKENFYETEMNTVFERMHFEGEEIDAWHAYNVINTINVAGEFVVTDNWYFKPITGVHVISDCSFSKVGAAIAYRSMNGNVTVKNNSIENIVFGMMLYDAGNYATEGTSIISNNQISGCVLDVVWLLHSENNVIEHNTISGSMFGNGIYCSSSDHNYIQKNDITDCGGSGIYLEESSQNIIFKNSLADNTVDLNSDGQGVNFWIKNDYTSAQNVSLVNSIEEEFDSLETQLNQADKEKSSLQSELQSANTMIASLQSDLEEADAQLSNIEGNLELANIEVSNLESQLSSANSEIVNLERHVASSLSYTIAGTIAVVVAILFGVVGFFAGKRT